MLRPRIIPALLLKNQGLVKTVKFKNPVYIGDPINTVKIFNEKCVDELAILDINATLEGKSPQLDLIARIASEAFMPIAYGGGIHNLTDIKDILSIGVEKIVINSHAVEKPEFVTAASDMVGSQSIVVSIDVRKSIWGNYEVVTQGGKNKTGLDPVSFACRMEQAGAGELLVNAVDRDGTMDGYDIGLIQKVVQSVGIPVIACGGAASAADLGRAINEGGASAAAAGSMFVFYGKHRAVLITVPDERELIAAGVLANGEPSGL